MPTREKGDGVRGNQVITRRDQRERVIERRGAGIPMKQAPTRRATRVRNPFSVMRRVMSQMERMLTSDRAAMPGPRAWTPQVDVTQRGDTLVVTADLPGLREDQIRIFHEGNSLVLEGEREDVREEWHGEIWESERVYGSFRRVIPLPEGADADQAVARFANGVLEISMPFPESARRRRMIKVTSGRTS